jgi:hypothetical protein
MAWALINVLDEYDFSEEKRKDSVGILSPPPRKWPHEYTTKTGGRKITIKQAQAIATKNSCGTLRTFM